MHTQFKEALENVLSQLKDSLGDDAANLISSMGPLIIQRQSSFETLFEALQNGDINEEEYELEVQREKQIIEAELMTLEIQAKSAVQKALNSALDALKANIVRGL